MTQFSLCLNYPFGSYFCWRFLHFSHTWALRVARWALLSFYYWISAMIIYAMNNLYNYFQLEAERNIYLIPMNKMMMMNSILVRFYFMNSSYHIHFEDSMDNYRHACIHVGCAYLLLIFIFKFMKIHFMRQHILSEPNFTCRRVKLIDWLVPMLSVSSWNEMIHI